MRILLICDTIDGRGGWYTYTRDLRKSLSAAGHDVALCCRHGSHGPYDVLKAPLAYVRNPLQVWSSAMKLKRVVREVQPDVIHITVEPYAMMIPFLGKRIAGRTVLTIHGSYGIRPLERPAQRAIAMRYYKQAVHFIAVSNYTKEAVIKELKRRKNDAFAESFAQRTTVVHNGIPLPGKWEASLENKRKNILLVGGVKPRKGVLEALDACALYKEKGGSPFVLSLIGTAEEDDYLSAVRAKIHDLKLQEEVQILGPVSQDKLESMYRTADLYLMPALTIPNTFEGFGLVYLEANAYGVPCIGPNDSGAKEAIAEGRSGYCIDPKSPEQIAERMRWILDEERIRRVNCRKWAEEHSIEKTVKEIESVYLMVQSAS